MGEQYHEKNPKNGEKLNQTLIERANDNIITDQTTNIDTVLGMSNNYTVNVKLDIAVKHAHKNSELCNYIGKVTWVALKMVQ